MSEINQIISISIFATTISNSDIAQGKSLSHKKISVSILH